MSGDARQRQGNGVVNERQPFDKSLEHTSRTAAGPQEQERG